MYPDTIIQNRIEIPHSHELAWKITLTHIIGLEKIVEQFS